MNIYSRIEYLASKNVGSFQNAYALNLTGKLQQRLVFVSCTHHQWSLNLFGKPKKARTIRMEKLYEQNALHQFALTVCLAKNGKLLRLKVTTTKSLVHRNLWFILVCISLAPFTIALCHFWYFLFHFVLNKYGRFSFCVLLLLLPQMEIIVLILQIEFFCFSNERNKNWLDRVGFGFLCSCIYRRSDTD